MTKPTGNPVGRPKTKEYSTLLARVPQDLVDRVKRYASVHRLPVAELIRDGLEWRITEGDPRNAFLYDTNNNEYSSNTETQTALAGMDLTPDMVDTGDLDTMPLGVSVGMPTEAVLAQLDGWKSAGLSLQAMADHLEAAHVPTLSGKGHWTKGTIGKLLAKHQAQPVA